MKELLDSINKIYGKGSVMRLGDKPSQYEVIPSGNYQINKALGVGGWTRGRNIEVYGMESSGKSTLALHAVAECQKLGLQAAYLDVEHCVDLEYAKAIGVDVDNLLFAQPDYGEQCLDILISLIESKELALIVVDSVAMLTPKAEIEGTMEDNQIGLQARMMGKVCRKIVASSAKNNVCVLWINQIRYKTNISFGNPETRPCGKALDFMTSVMVKISKTDVEKDKSGAGGKIVVQKNKMAPPFKIAEFDIVFGKGIESGLVDAAVEAGIIVKNGAWYSYKENRLGQGKDNSDDFIRTNPQLLAEITQKLKEKEFGAG